MRRGHASDHRSRGGVSGRSRGAPRPRQGRGRAKPHVGALTRGPAGRTLRPEADRTRASLPGVHLSPGEGLRRHGGRSWPRRWEEINARIAAGEAVVVTAEEFAQIAAADGVKRRRAQGGRGHDRHVRPDVLHRRVLQLRALRPADQDGRDLAQRRAGVRRSRGGGHVPRRHEPSETRGIEYGGAHVIEDLLRGKRGAAQGQRARHRLLPAHRDRHVGDARGPEPGVPLQPAQRLPELRGGGEPERPDALHLPRHAASRTSATRRTARAGALSPLLNDPTYRTIGVGTRCFVAGAPGYVAWQGTQHNPNQTRDDHGVPVAPAGTLAVIADLKQAESGVLRGGDVHQVRRERVRGHRHPDPGARRGHRRHARAHRRRPDGHRLRLRRQRREAARRSGRSPTRELRSGTIEIEGRKIPAGPISSRAKARRIASTLKSWVAERRWTLTEPLAPLPGPGEQGTKPLEIRGPDGAQGGPEEPPIEGTDEVEEVLDGSATP